MKSVEDRVADLAENHLGVSDRAMLDVDFSELAITSINAVNFMKKVNEEFGTEVTGEQAADMTSLRDLINHLEG